MRAAVLSLIIAAGLTGAAEAQAPAMTTPGPSTPAPATAPPSGPASTTSSAPLSQLSPVPPAAAPSPAGGAPQGPPAPAQAPPTLPTSGDGAAIVSLIEKVCVPSVRGQDLDTVAKAAGLRGNRRDGTWTMALGGDRAYVAVVQPQFSNKNVCQVEVHYAVGQDQPIVDAINIWSFLHKPELILQANYVNVGADGIKRVRKSWEHVEANASTAVNFSVERNANDTPLNAHYDTGMLFYQERKF